jgi:hypothetical protein
MFDVAASAFLVQFCIFVFDEAGTAAMALTVVGNVAVAWNDSK